MNKDRYYIAERSDLLTYGEAYGSDLATISQLLAELDLSQIDDLVVIKGHEIKVGLAMKLEEDEGASS